MSADHTPWYEPAGDRKRFDFAELVAATTPTVVVRDTQLERRDSHARAQLRSIPLFQLYGFETVLHTEVWDNQFKLVDYEPVLTEDVDDASTLSFPLVHVVTQQGITEYGEEPLVRQLIERSLDEDGRYVLVTDTVAPRTPTYTRKPGKSLVDEFAAIRVQNYDHLSSVVLESHLDSAIPVVDTKNLFFHAASTIHSKRGAPASSIDDIFDFTQAPADSPVWESPRYFIEHDLENVLDDYSERIREALRSWAERGDTQRTANHILETLQVCDYSLDQLDEYRQRSPPYR